MLTEAFKHIDLKEIAARVEPSVQRVSARGRTYVKTEPGMADYATVVTGYALAEIWKADPEKAVRMPEVEPTLKQWLGPEAVIRLAAALKRLARIGQIKLDFDRDGVTVRPGSAWIET
jgi:hypothetical protein